MVGKPQRVSVTWENEDLADTATKYTFTYKPDPDIVSTYPNVSIVK